MSSSVDLKEFVTGFIVEAEEYLDSVNRNLVAASEALKQHRPEPRAVRELFRSLHTIKGLASMIGADPIVAISHEMEGILRLADRAGGVLSDQTLDLLSQGTRAIEERVQAIAKMGVGSIPAAPSQLLEELALSQNSEVSGLGLSDIELLIPHEILKNLSVSDQQQVRQAIQSGRRVVVIDFQPSPQKAQEGFNITSVRDHLGKLGDLVKVIPRSSPGAPTGIVFSLLLATNAENSALAEAAGSGEESILDVGSKSSAQSDALDLQANLEPQLEWTPSDHSSIRVDIRRLDEALERLADLVVTRSKLAKAAADLKAKGADTRDLLTVIGETTRQLKRLRAAITKARMVPLAELLQRLPLVIRGLTKDSDKSVNLVMQVGSAEVDKAVADKIFPAIVHLVRNAIDHAIETKSERYKDQKPEIGTLSVLCDDTSGTNLVLTIRDDGRGIDREAVACKAGLPVAKSDEKLLDQITMPGLSTREEVSTTSGRGMGMDIVRRTVEMLGGSLELSTSTGKGTTFKLQIPVSITIVDVLSFVSAGQTYVVPVAMIDEIIEIDVAQLMKSPNPGRRELEPHLIQRRGEAIPFLTLDMVMNKRKSKTPSMALVVNQNKTGAIAFGVDRMIGQQEVVVRPLDDVLVRVPGMSGATDLGDGKPTLVLDLATMGAVINKNIEVTV
jgi:two-component system, chemotaxis family, sensor kinase CheA